MKKYTQAEIKKFLEPETRFHMSAHVIQTEALEMCRQLHEQLYHALSFIEDLIKTDHKEISNAANYVFEEIRKLGSE